MALEGLISAQAKELLLIIVPLIVILTGYGAFVLGFMIAVQSLTMRGTWGRPQTILLVCLVTILVCFTWVVFYNGGILLMLDRYTFMQTLEQGLSAQVQAADTKTVIWQYMPDWPATINTFFHELLLSDGIVVWRAWCLFQQDRYWRLLLLILMIANIGVNVADCIWPDVKLANKLSESTALDWLSAVLSLVVNLVVTSLVACKAWSHHRWISARLNGHLTRQGTRAENILNLLIESGAIFCTMQSIYVIIVVLSMYNIVSLVLSEIIETL
ncbi:hypothetical protein BDP27DRAFT_1450582, partial [Rhodocollybia butyracea]